MENKNFQIDIEMENKKVPIKLTDFQKHEESPFHEQAIEVIEKKLVKKFKNSTHATSEQRAVAAVADINTGEVFQTSFIRRIEVDEDQFTKIYLAEFSAAFFDLSQSAIRVFGYIMNCMKPKRDMIVFDRKKCMEYTKYKSEKAIYKGLAELVAAEIIARGPADNLWFINPLIVFNGDRASYTREIIKKKKLTKKEEEEAKKKEQEFNDKFEEMQLQFGFEEQHSIE